MAAPGSATRRALFEVWPALEDALPLCRLGELPTPVQALDGVARPLGRPSPVLFVKRDDLSAPTYGGNKVRTLELLFGKAKQRGATHIWSTGAFGSNHAAATVAHARSAGLEPGVLLFPQPASWTALANLRAILAGRPRATALLHWSTLPLGMWRLERSERRAGRPPFVMVPGGATPEGALGYVSAAFELALQVASGELPPPATVIIGVGSTCTSAGLLLGFALAARRGLGFVDAQGRAAPPRLISVRVTPWPVTAAFRIVGLAARTGALLAKLTGDGAAAVERTALAAGLHVDGRFLGAGYGHPTDSGADAIRRWRDAGGPELDTTYSGKSAASVVERLRSGEAGPIVYWATKSTAALPEPDADVLGAAPGRMRRWIENSERELRRRGVPRIGI